ncbi:3'-phosphatase, 5'-polynucleotide kinase [Pseudomonas phage vB_Paer_PsIn]|uniref:3'-phosphatase, 5'-polynucleotide kinase n=1 Tax=Pseudomonas phage vB_Paer_PsIn TaxID=2924907 RepID=A0A9Y1G0H5_9CAUD|nr:3'-phosphatase, 5'-polynucleotide kinase [Pseudomonas phage vB_Paer_PsIn]UOL48105.1 3'-phosphatase, 5'-polynucleotide kinase [Pseudomonas phage vB_Paer_PsIn]
MQRSKNPINIQYWDADTIPYGTVLVVTEERGDIRKGELVVRLASSADDEHSVRVCRFSDFFLLMERGYDAASLGDVKQAYDVLFEDPPATTFVNWDRAQPLTNSERYYGDFLIGGDPKGMPLFNMAVLKNVLSPYTADDAELSAMSGHVKTVEHKDADELIERLQGSAAEVLNVKGNDSIYDEYKKEMRAVAENEEQGLIFANLEDYLGKENYATLEAMANHKEAVGSGGSSSYYTVKVNNPTTKANMPYFAECNDIIEALDMRFGQGNMFKALWRAAAAQNLGKLKAGNDVIRDYEKVIFFAQLEIDKILRERG